jgi:N-acetylglutamate synthase-like GNAT family acetyltransferase
VSETDTGDPAIQSFLEKHKSDWVARRGELIDAVRRPNFVARDAREIVGILTYDIVGESCEVLTLHCTEQWSGIGTRLMDALVKRAHELGCRHLWVVTTNDNVDALRFYQRRGFRLTALRSGAVDESRRTVKPAIPAVGFYGIPVRDELELSRTI